jgi:hypothetical protein
MFSRYLVSRTVADEFLVTSLREGMALRTRVCGVSRGEAWNGHSERGTFVYDGVMPTLMKFLCSFYG